MTQLTGFVWAGLTKMLRSRHDGLVVEHLLPKSNEDDMAPMAQRLWKAGNAVAVWMYRRTGGKVGGRAKGGSPVLLLTVAGRRSGIPHTVPVAYVERDGVYFLAATAGGQPREPQWVRNLRAASTATIEVGREKRSMSVEVLRGTKSDEAWKDIIVATYPSFAPYEAKSGRSIAVARLSPFDSASL